MDEQKRITTLVMVEKKRISALWMVEQKQIISALGMVEQKRTISTLGMVEQRPKSIIKQRNRRNVLVSKRRFHLNYLYYILYIINNHR